MSRLTGPFAAAPLGAGTRPRGQPGVAWLMAGLLASLGLAAALRLAWPGQIFVHADEVLWAYFPLKLHTHSLLTWDLLDNPLAQLARWNYGYFYVAFLYLYTGLLSTLGVPITEATLVLPCAVMGVLSVFLVDRVTRDVCGAWPGVVAAGLLAVIPLHVGLSRTMEVNRVPASFLQILTVYLFARYLRRPSAGRAWLASAVLALYVVSQPQFPGLVPVLLFMGYAFAPPDRDDVRLRIGWAVRTLLRPATLVLPAVALVPPLLVFGYGLAKGNPGGYLGYLIKKPKLPGFYLLDVAGHTVANVGLPVALLLLLGFAWGVRALVARRPPAVLLVWSLAYLGPFLLLVPDAVTGTREYLLDGTLPVLLLTAWALSDLLAGAGRPGLAPRRAVVGVVLVGALGSALWTTARDVFNLRPDGSVGLQRYETAHLGKNAHVFGSVRQDNGIKAAGYFIREHVPPDARVFSDMTHIHGAYYLGRRVFAIEDSDLPAILRYFQTVQAEVDVLVVNRYHVDAFESHLAAQGSGLMRSVEIRTGGEPVMAIYSRLDLPRAILSTEEVGPLFDRRYGAVRRLVTEWGQSLRPGPERLVPTRSPR